MKNWILFLVIVGMPPAVASAQHGHSDVVFGFDNTSSPTTVEIENDNVTSEGFQFFESGLVADAFDATDFATDDPGFVTEAADNLLFGAGDHVFLTAVNGGSESGLGAGFVSFFSEGAAGLTAAGEFTISDSTGGTTDLSLNGANHVGGSLRQLIQVADGDGDVHSHVEFDLENEGAIGNGAFGILFQIDVDRNIGGGPDGTIDVSSDKFWIVFNHGLDEEVFENQALAAFGAPAAVPEPGSLAALSAIGLLGVLTRRRRNS